MRLSTRLSYNFNVFYENKRKKGNLSCVYFKSHEDCLTQKRATKVALFSTLMAYLAVSHLLSLMAFWTTNSTDHCC